ncbi:hypothetical protein Q7C36_020109 [Tachysurus vachellii]|uniref:Uncharacterized protein n=1 Tax=Tachysurus vachellii TaxID=175792 RepID=A0AA88LT27_TACVA|nr:hypothetical protein Q7C36_020109 [Tachysurus vachellii]
MVNRGSREISDRLVSQLMYPQLHPSLGPFCGLRLENEPKPSQKALISVKPGLLALVTKSSCLAFLKENTANYGRRVAQLGLQLHSEQQGFLCTAESVFQTVVV